MLTTGCWNRRELNDLAVSVAIGVDKKGDGIVLSDQILNSKALSGKQGTSNIAPVTLFKETGKGLQEAARRMTMRSTRKVYVGQLQMLIFGEAFAKAGVGKVLDHITRDHEYRSDFYVVITRGAKAQDLLQIYTPLERTPATRMKNTLEVSSKAWGATTAVKIDDFVSAIVSKGREAVLPGIVIVGDPKRGNDQKNTLKILPSTRLTYSGLGVFRKDKLLGWLNEQESRGYNYTQGNIKSTTVLLPCPQQKQSMTVELIRTKSKTKVVLKDGKPAIQVKIKAEGAVTDAQCPMDFTKPNPITELEQMVQADIQDSVSAALKIMQNKYKSDIFGFGEDVERKYPKYWAKVQHHWNVVFSEMKVDVKAEVKIKEMYKTTKSFADRMKE